MTQESGRQDFRTAIGSSADRVATPAVNAPTFPAPDDPDGLYQASYSALTGCDLDRGIAWRNAAQRAGLDGDRLAHLDIEAAYRSTDWAELSACVAPDRDFDLPAIACPWIRVACGRMVVGDGGGATLAIERFLQLRPSDFSFVAGLVKVLDLPAQDRNLAHLLRTVISAGAKVQDIETICATLKRDAKTTLRLETFRDLATQAEQAVAGPAGKLARDWALAVWQPTAAPADEHLTHQERDQLATALQAALNGDFMAASSGIAALTSTLRSDFILARLAEAERLLTHIAHAPTPVRPDLDNCPREVAISDTRGSRRLAIVFTGLGERVSGLPISIFDRLLAIAGYRTIFLRDSSRGGFACGI